MNGLDLFRSPKTAADEIADIVSAQCPPVVPENCDAFSCRECWLAWLTIEVKESAQIDEQEVEGSATKPKQATGYEDAKVNIELILDDTPTQTKYQRLETLRAIFRTPGQSVPKPLSIVSEDTAAHGVDKVLFKGLTHKMENKKEQLTVSLEFWEYVPQTIQTTSSSSGSSSGGGSSGGSSGGTQQQTTLSSDYQKYLQTSRGKSPAVDDASTAAALDKVSQMPY